MKICAYCGSKLADNVVFTTICPDCRAFVQQRSKKKSKLFAVLITLFFAVWFVALIFVFNSHKITFKPVNNSETVSRNLPDMELLTLKDHPKFYGDHKAAESFWKGFDKVKVVSARQKLFNEDALLLVTTGVTDNDVITNVTINLSDYEKKHSLELDNVMRLICDYIPYDIIEQYYDFEESFHEIHENGQYEAYHYVMELNDKGKEVNQSGERYLESKFAFQIIHRNDNDWIATINYLAYEGNHNKFKADAQRVEAWDVDIEKYKK